MTGVDSFNRWDVYLTRENLKGRAFLLGNKRAFSLSLPAASGLTDTQLHPHKWFGAYLYGRKFFEAQVTRARVQREHPLNHRVQTGFTMGLASARRDYQVEGRPCSEEFFVPDGIQGFACTLVGDVDFAIEPEFDMRHAIALVHDTCAYTLETWERGALIAHPLPRGTYDDATETFWSDETGDEAETYLYAAIEVVGDDARAEERPASLRSRRKAFHKDRNRHRMVSGVAPEEARYDHAPLWAKSDSRVYVPLRLSLHGHGTVFYGFGASPEEALEQLAALRDNLIGFQVQKNEAMADIMTRASFATGMPRVDTAYGQVLARLMDGLVARHAVAQDTALDRPATMILAGNQYFHDSWKRDENIALGFLLSLGFYELARDVINDTWQLQDEATGRLPQRIRVGEDPPYHSSDGTLWALQRLYQYWRCTGDEALLRAKLPMVQHFFHRSLERAVDGMLPSGRTHAPDYLWETWMDTPHTPRDGFPIEIQMLWISCLRLFRPILDSLDPELAQHMETAEAAAWNGLQRFYVRGMPADSLDTLLQVRDLITPNPYFCFGVGLDLGPEVERHMRDMGRRQLAGHQGIKTLAPQDWDRVFSAEFLSDRRTVRGRRMKSIGKFNYHRGVEWNWLSQFFVQAELKYGEPDVAFRTYVKPQVRAVLEQAGIGGISELFDLSGTRGPEFQAWSMAGFLESLHAFAGVRIDVPDRTIRIEPQIPDLWPQLHVRKWYGSVPFDLRYTNDDGVRSLRVEFPWGDAPDVDLEIAFALPARRMADFLEVVLDGERQVSGWQVETIAGTEQRRIRLRVPARTRVEVTLGSRRAAGRLAVTA